MEGGSCREWVVRLKRRSCGEGVVKKMGHVERGFCREWVVFKIGPVEGGRVESGLCRERVMLRGGLIESGS